MYNLNLSKKYFILFLVINLFTINPIKVQANEGSLDFSIVRNTFFAGEKSISIGLRNKETNPYLIQSKIGLIDLATGLDFIDNSNDLPFIITPPLYKLESNDYYKWRIFLTEHSKKLPQDRESIYLVEFRAIPSTTESKNEQQTQLTILRTFYFRIYYRPEKIKSIKIKDVENKLVVYKKDNQLIAKNDSPLFLSFASLAIGEYSIDETQLFKLVPPFGEQSYLIPTNASGEINWSIFDEYIFPLNNRK